MLSNRVHWKPDPARAVLLLHDMQEYFLDFYDGKEEPIPTFLEHIGRLRETCDIASVPVVAQLAPREQDTVLVKLSYSAFVRSDLLQRMQVQCRDQLIMCGVCAYRLLDDQRRRFHERHTTIPGRRCSGRFLGRATRDGVGLLLTAVRRCQAVHRT